MKNQSNHSSLHTHTLRMLRDRKNVVISRTCVGSAYVSGHAKVSMRSQPQGWDWVAEEPQLSCGITRAATSRGRSDGTAVSDRKRV